MYDDDAVVLQEVWNDHTVPEYTFADVVLEAVDVLAYDYVQKNKGKKPTKAMINEWIERLMKEYSDE